MLVSLYDVLRILTLVAVGLLNGAAAGRIVARDRQAKFRPIRQLKR